jgi:arabinofuranosyltransferase
VKGDTPGSADPLRTPFRTWSFVLLAAAALFLLTLIVRTAWMSDDAYITLRTIGNWRAGYGLRWNISERVQAYTHPLWLFLEALASSITGEPYFSSIALSIGCTLAAAVVLAMSARSGRMGAAALLLAGTSRAFVDYATSGLETPLTYLLLTGLLAAYWKNGRSARWALATVMLAALIGVNRLDALVLVAPAIVHLAMRSRTTGKTVFLAGFVPLFVWEAFSILYYGFAVPNTAYAKLATGIPRPELVAQGVAYLSNSWRIDPVTLSTIAAALAVSVWRPRVETATIAAGILLHLGYVVFVGGDFMSGRFLAPAFLAAVAILVRHPVSSGPRAVAGSVVLILAILHLPATVSRAWTTRPFPPVEALIDANGIADERLIYARDTGLLSALRRHAAPDTAWERSGRHMRDLGVRVMTRDSVGFFGYGAGPTVHIVDTVALCDPLLARLPARRPWRIGHFYRDLPAGYIDLLRGRQDRLADPALNDYYPAVRLVTRGPLWSRARWAAIVRLNLQPMFRPRI